MILIIMVLVIATISIITIIKKVFSSLNRFVLVDNSRKQSVVCICKNCFQTKFRYYFTGIQRI